MSEEPPFSKDWVHYNLDVRRGGRYPRPEARNRIAEELNRVFAENSPRINTGSWPHFLRLPRGDAQERIRRGDTEISHPNKRQWLWYDFVLSLAEVIGAELEKVIPGTGYSAKGPVVKLLTKAIPLITCEIPLASAVAKEIERQRKLKLCDKPVVMSHTK